MTFKQVRAEGRSRGSGVPEHTTAKELHGSEEDAEGSVVDGDTVEQIKTGNSGKNRKKRLRRKLQKKREDAESDEWNGNASDITHDEFSDFDPDLPIKASKNQFSEAFRMQNQPEEDLRFVQIYDVNVTLPKTHVSMILIPVEM